MYIERATIDDLDTLTTIAKKCTQHLNAQSIYQWDDIYPSRKDFHDDILKQNLYVVIVNNDISGCICINQLELPGYENADWHGCQFYVIHKLMVDPHYEHQSIGKFAMKYAEDLARSERKDSIRLDCFRDNIRANTFYQKLGYCLRGQTKFRKGMFNLYEKMLP